MQSVRKLVEDAVSRGRYPQIIKIVAAEAIICMYVLTIVDKMQQPATIRVPIKKGEK